MGASSSDIRAGGAFIEIGGRDVGFKKLSAEANASLKGLAVNFAKVAASLSVMAGAIAVPLIKLTNDFVKFAYEIRITGRKIGLASDDMSKLTYTAEMADVGIEKLTFAIKFMERNIYLASKQGTIFSSVCKELGIDTKQLRTALPLDAFLLFADKISSLKDPVMQTATAMQVFGRGGMDILPALKEGSTGFKQYAADAAKLGVVVSIDVSDKVTLFRDSLDNLRMSILGMGGAIAKSALPVLQMFVEKFTGMFIAIRQLIEQNPRLISQLVYIGRLLGIVAATFAGLSVVLFALSQPFLWFAGIVTIVVLSLLESFDILNAGVNDSLKYIWEGFTLLGASLKQWATWFTLWADTIGSSLMYSISTVISFLLKQVQIAAGILLSFVALMEKLNNLSLPGRIMNRIAESQGLTADNMMRSVNKLLQPAKDVAPAYWKQRVMDAQTALGTLEGSLPDLNRGKPALSDLIGKLKDILAGIGEAPPFPTKEHAKTLPDQELADIAKKAVTVTGFFGGMNPYEHMGGAGDVAREQLSEQRGTNRLLRQLITTTEEGVGLQ